MFVHENVMDKAGIIMEKSGTDEAESLDELRPEESPLDALKRKLEQAIKEERYEEAARLRDEINKMTKAN
jgi:protein-arginine kinase activator protein McsA